MLYLCTVDELETMTRRCSLTYCYKPNNQTTKQLNNQTTKQPNNQIIKTPLKRQRDAE